MKLQKMKWKYERREDWEWVEKRKRERKVTRVERIWVSEDKRYTIFNTVGQKTYAVQLNEPVYYVLGERYRSLGRAKGVCEQYNRKADWGALAREREELDEVMKQSGAYEQGQR